MTHPSGAQTQPLMDECAAAGMGNRLIQVDFNIPGSAVITEIGRTFQSKHLPFGHRQTHTDTDTDRRCKADLTGSGVSDRVRGTGELRGMEGGAVGWGSKIRKQM